MLLDLDGKFATANENDLIGFGISKPVASAGSQVSAVHYHEYAIHAFSY